MRKMVAILILSGMLLPICSLALDQPGTIDEAKELGEEVFETTKRDFPGVLETLWQESVLPVWQKMYITLAGWWNNSIGPWFENVWYKFVSFFGKEIEKRKPIIKEELEKEKQEIKEDVKEGGSNAGSSLWEKFKDIIR